MSYVPFGLEAEAGKPRKGRLLCAKIGVLCPANSLRCLWHLQAVEVPAAECLRP